MSLLDLFRRRETRSADPSWAAASGGLPMVSTGGYVSPQLAESLSTVSACVSAISGSISALPARLYKNSGKARQERIVGDFCALVRRGPNAYQSWPEFVEMLVAQVLLRGNGLVEISSDAHGALTGLRCIPWDWVNVTLLPSGRLVYDVSYQPGLYGCTSGGTRKRLLQGDVIHIRDRSDDGIVGVSRIQRGAATIRQALTVADYAANTFRNGVAVSGVLAVEGKLLPEQRRDIQRDLRASFAGTQGAGRVMVLGDNMTWQGMQVVSPEDAELLESRKWSTEELCRLFSVPPPVIQDYSHNTFTNSETAGRWFAQFCLLPLVRKIEAAFNAALWPDGKYELDLDMSGFDRGDPETRWKNHAIAAQHGILSIDEIREVEGYSPGGNNVPASK